MKSNNPTLDAKLLGRLKAISDRPAGTGDSVSVGPHSKSRPARKTTFKQGMLLLPMGERLPVVIKDISDTGARVEFFQNRTLEGQVRLEEQSLGLSIKAKIVWQTGSLVGLSFI